MPGGTGVPGALMRLSPLVSPYNPDGTVNIFPLAGSIDAAVYVNPLTLKTDAGAILNQAAEVAGPSTVSMENGRSSRD